MTAHNMVTKSANCTSLELRKVARKSINPVYINSYFQRTRHCHCHKGKANLKIAASPLLTPPKNVMSFRREMSIHFRGNIKKIKYHLCDYIA